MHPSPVSGRREKREEMGKRKGGEGREGIKKGMRKRKRKGGEDKQDEEREA